MNSADSGTPRTTPNDDLCKSALDHYERASSAIHEWYSVIPLAIKTYYQDGGSEAAALRADLEQMTKERGVYMQTAEGFRMRCESLRADRDALAVELGDAIAFMQQAADLGILNAEECAPILQQYKQALAAHGGKP